jgi:peroxiredoxin
VTNPCQQEKRLEVRKRRAPTVPRAIAPTPLPATLCVNFRWRAALSVVAAVLLIAVADANAGSAADLDPLLRGLSVRPWWGDPPATALQGLDGSRHLLPEAKGRVLLLYFWATWCPVCTGELPSQIETLHRDLGGQGLEIWAVSMRESPDRVANWLELHPVSTPVLLDRDGIASDAFRATGTPTFVLVDRSGQLVGRGVGPRDWSGASARALLRALLGSP